MNDSYRSFNPNNPNEASDYFDEILDDLVAKINFRGKILSEINRIRQDPY